MSATVGNLAVTVEALREQIRRLQAAPRKYLAALRTGVEAFDALLPGGGLPLGQVVELWGERASGRTSLALRAVASAHREGRLCAYVDGAGELYPPAAVAAGVDPSRLLIVRPRTAEQLAWSAVQLVRSGAFACVVLDLTRAPPGTARAEAGVRLSPAEGKRLLDAAGRGGTLLLLLTAPEAPADGMLRLRTEPRGDRGLSVEVVRSRQGGLGSRALVPWRALYPELAEGECPWGAELLPTEPMTVPELPREPSSREGHRGILGQRPGRDAPLPSLRPHLDASPALH
ncbi:recombinase RecA [Melittangium boletus]|uniref:Protein RecA n=1 Tax=Melittangium boletus DSM 14713 TaxID=1294270 RepID=A0A250IQY3_9BACT|nr:recombinase RecA [Melittangium boletus]ATB34144.1 RecA protein [Melittangium boletus DSM 14713]